MMRNLTAGEGCVRLECLSCGAHTPLARDDYEKALRRRRNVWCSTCGRLRPIQARFERQPEIRVERTAKAAFAGLRGARALTAPRGHVPA